EGILGDAVDLAELEVEQPLHGVVEDLGRIRGDLDVGDPLHLERDPAPGEGVVDLHLDGDRPQRDAAGPLDQRDAEGPAAAYDAIAGAASGQHHRLVRLGDHDQTADGDERGGEQHQD